MIREFVVPSINKFGEGSLASLGEIAGVKGFKKALIITDVNLVKNNIVKPVLNELENIGLDYVVFDSVQPNPTKTNVYEALDIYNKNACDFIIGVGGGSPNDCSKAVAILATNGGVLEDYEGGNRSKNLCAPLIAINTTAGTASEISRAYLISDEEKKEKLIAKDNNALPICSINDPILMVGLPASITGATGMDALTHAVESYVANNSYVLSKELAIVGTKLVFKNLPLVLKNPTDIKIRENMTYAQSVAGMAFCNSGVGIAHSLAHALGATFKLAHGLCTSIVLPEVIRFNRMTVENEYSDLARGVFPIECNVLSDSQSVDFLIEKIEELSQLAGTKISLGDLGITENDLDELADKAFRDGNTGRNPVMPTREELRKILQKVM